MHTHPCTRTLLGTPRPTFGVQSELQEAAAELIRQSDNPKFAQSKFMQFVKSIGAGDVTLDTEGKQVSLFIGTAVNPPQLYL